MKQLLLLCLLCGMAFTVQAQLQKGMLTGSVRGQLSMSHSGDDTSAGLLLMPEMGVFLSDHILLKGSLFLAGRVSPRRGNVGIRLSPRYYFNPSHNRTNWYIEPTFSISTDFDPETFRSQRAGLSAGASHFLLPGFAVDAYTFYEHSWSELSTTTNTFGIAGRLRFFLSSGALSKGGYAASGTALGHWSVGISNLGLSWIEHQNLQGLSVNAGRFIHPKIMLGLGLSYHRNSIEADSYSLKVSQFILFPEVRYYFHTDRRLNWFAHLGAGLKNEHSRSKNNIDIIGLPIQEPNYNATNFLGAFGAGCSFMLAESLALDMKAGLSYEAVDLGDNHIQVGINEIGLRFFWE